VDASPEALKRATERAIAAQATSHFTLDAFVSTTEEMALLEPRRFDLIWAIEVICYTAEPVETMRRLLQLLKPGGILVMSVEGRVGSALGDPRLGPAEAKAALVSGRRTRQGDVAVSYFTRQELTDAMSVAGFEAIEVQGSHYVLEGPCAHLLERTVEGKERTAAALGLERLCRQHPHLSDLARAWIGIGTRGR
jgi:SAM-dependent methyltransferase